MERPDLLAARAVELTKEGLELFGKTSVLLAKLDKTTATIASVATSYRCGKRGRRHPG
jgi:hypothetical protein